MRVLHKIQFGVRGLESICLLAVCMEFSIAKQHPADPQTPTFRVDSSLVLVDVIIYTQDQICYYNNAFGPAPSPACPTSLGYAPPAVPALGFYSSQQHFVHAGVSWKPAKQIKASVGYAGTFVGGTTTEINSLQVPGTLAFNYQTPYVTAIWNLYKGLSYRMTWNYYGYNGKGLASNEVPGLAPIATPDFNGSTTEFALRYSF